VRENERNWKEQEERKEDGSDIKCVNVTINLIKNEN
jgi:hypothetical protein